MARPKKIRKSRRDFQPDSPLMYQEIKAEWTDAQHWDDDIPLAELLKEPDAVYTTWGTCVEDSDGRMTIVSTWHRDGSVKEATRIPPVLDY